LLFGRLFQNKEALFIDPAGDEEDLADRVVKKGLDLKYIVNTHGHGINTCATRG